MFDSFWLLYFGDEWDIPLFLFPICLCNVLLDKVFCFTHIFWSADKAERDVIYPVFDAKLQIIAILLCQRRGAHCDPWQVDTLMLSKRTTMNDQALHIGSVRAQNAQFQ